MPTDELILLRDYAKEHGYSMYLMKQWIEDGLKHKGTRPYRTKLSWINEYIENSATQKNNSNQARTSKKSTRIASKIRCGSRIDINEFI